ncbi:MAG TPA: DUF2855 family protein [Pseudonocardiaceae bacterium]
MTTVDSWDLLVRRDDLAATAVVPAQHAALAPGEVRLAVEKFALTMNSVTYARLGESVMPFFAAFPGPAGYGRVPVWAFLRVTESRNDDVPVGGRYFGFVPMSTHHTVAARRTSRGFVDTAPFREFMPVWYRTFQDAAEPDTLDDRRTVFRPIFPASFHLADFLAGHEERGAKSVLITSASSRTAIGLAMLLARQSDLPTTGITSPRYLDFVAGLGCYDTVACYDQLDSVSLLAPAVFVDFTGEHRRIAAVYDRFPGELAHTALVGYTHPESVQVPPELTEPEPEIFFTPVVEEQIVADEGEDTFYARYHESEQRFLESTTAWLTVRRQQGPAAIADVFRGLLAGSQPPGVSYLLSP